MDTAGSPGVALRLAAFLQMGASGGAASVLGPPWGLACSAGASACGVAGGGGGGPSWSYTPHGPAGGSLLLLQPPRESGDRPSVMLQAAEPLRSAGLRVGAAGAALGWAAAPRQLRGCACRGLRRAATFPGRSLAGRSGGGGVSPSSPGKEGPGGGGGGGAVRVWRMWRGEGGCAPAAVLQLPGARIGPCWAVTSGTRAPRPRL